MTAWAAAHSFSMTSSDSFSSVPWTHTAYEWALLESLRGIGVGINSSHIDLLR